MNKRKITKAIKRLSKLPKNKYLLKYISNKIRHVYLKTINSTKVAFPSTIMLELTNHCNLACTTCPREYDYGKEMDLGNMDLHKAKTVVDELWPYLDSIGLTGMGETFIYNELEEIVDYIKQKNEGIIISVSTNAILPNFIEKVTRLVNKIDTIQISIDGLEDVYELIRKKASFALLDKNLRLLSELCAKTDTTLMLNMVVTEENYIQMPELVSYAEKVGIDYMDFTLFNLASVTNIEQSYYKLYNSKEFLDVLPKLEKEISKTKKVTVTNRNFKTDNGFQKCPFPWTHFYVCWNGYITPCCAKPFPKELNFGNVFDTGIMDVLNSTAFQNWRKLWFANKTPDFCYKCHFIDIKPISTTN